MEGKLSITIHSGSRNPGHSVGGFYMQVSRNEDKKLPNGFLDLYGQIGQSYIADMEFMLEYALANRALMMTNVMKILGLRMQDYSMINENHNHAITIGADVLHRKGATPADKDQLGVIPGNMRDGVYITRGLGNEEYLSSASHGAGRRLSRTKAKETLSYDTFVSQMEGIVGVVNKKTLDEAPDAYKDINLVIERQSGVVVDIIDFIKPCINIKG